MILRLIERSEVVPVALDLGSIGDVEADGAENRLDARPGADHRMQGAAPAPPPGQGDIERFLGETCGELRVGERTAAGLEGA